MDGQMSSSPGDDNSASSAPSPSLSDKCSSDPVTPKTVTDEIQTGPSSSAYSQAYTELLIKASQLGEVSTVKLILSCDLDFSSIKSPETNRTPLHYASAQGHSDAVSVLLSKFSPFVEDRHGNTALHLAASNGHMNTINTLLAHESKCNQEVSESQHTNLLHQLNKEGLTPLGCALLYSTRAPHYNVASHCLSCTEGNPPDSFADFGRAYLTGYTESLLDKPVKIFVLGDRGAGKSTLTKSLQESRSVLSKLTFGLAATGRTIRSSEDKHFTGVITTEFYSPNSKRVLFYDMAGHTNYFNKDLVESTADIPHSIFIVLISLKDESTKVRERLVFWLNFLFHHLFCSPHHESEDRPNVIILGSHRDSRPFRRHSNLERLLKVFAEVQQQNSALINSFNFLMKPQSLDCRKFQTSEIRHLRAHLYRSCLKLAPTNPLPSSTSYILSSLLNGADFATLPALTLGKLAGIVRENSSTSDMSLYHLLPCEESDLVDLCNQLHSHQRIVLFSNPKLKENSSEGIWIVHNSHLILTAIDRQLASLNNPDVIENFFSSNQEKTLFSFGIVSRETLSRFLSRVQVTESEGFVLDTNLAIHLLQHFKYTEPIDPTTHCPVPGGVPLGEEAFFLPGLLVEEVGNPDKWEGEGYAFSLSIRSAPVGEGNIMAFFLPRFLKKLLLRLTQQFILRMGTWQEVPSSDDDDGGEGGSQCSQIENSTVWSRGVSWQTGGVRVYIATKDNAVILNMYSEPGQEIGCIRLRNEIVRTIHEVKSQYQDTIKTETFVLPYKDRMLPVESFEAYHNLWIPLDKIHQCLLDAKGFYMGTSIESLLFFEPSISLVKMPPPIVAFLSNSQNSTFAIGKSELCDIYESFGNNKESVVGYLHLPLIDKDDGSTASVTEYQVCDSEGSLASAPIGSAVVDSDGKSLTSLPNGAEVTCGKLLKNMSSLSLLNFPEFLNEIKGRPHRNLNTPSLSQTGTDDSEDIERDITRQPGQPSDNPSPVPEFRRLTSQSLLPFVGPTSLLEFTSSGSHFCLKEHNISVLVPSGAVTKGVEVEVGVLLTGPFKFPSNTTQVSTILWLSARNKKTLRFSKQVEVMLPHFIDCSDPEEVSNLTFMKATHDSSLSDKPFVFSEVDTSSFSGSKGSVFIKSCSFLCISHKSPKKLLEKTNFCLVHTVPRHIIENKFEMNFCVTHALKTCIEAVCIHYPDCRCDKQFFKFACDSTHTPALKIHCENHLKSGWKAGRTNLSNQIKASDVKLSMSQEDDVGFPLHFTIEVLGQSATEADVLYVTISGADRELELQKPLELIGRITRAATLSSINSEKPSFMPLKILDRNMTSIIQYLDINHLRPVLSQQGTLLPEEHDSLVQQCAEGNRKQVSIEALVGMLRHKGCRGIRDFILALNKTGQECLGHRDIVEILKEDSDFDYIMNSVEADR